MKYVVLIFALMVLPSVPAQTPKPKTQSKKPAAAKPKPVVTPTPSPTPTPLSEKEQFEKASAHELAADRVAALETFLAAFPESESRPAATDLMASSRALIGEEKLISGDADEAVRIFKLVVEQAPQPYPSELFSESIVKIPTSLFRHGHRSAAFELAGLIETRVENDTAQLLEIANFYLMMENGSEAMRVAAKAVAKDPTSAAAYRTLALAHRINFDIEESASAYAKAVELEPGSSSAKRGLAEMKRALGKSDEAASIYRELLSKDEADVPARTGLVLALFDAGKRTEAETELATTLGKTPGNFILLAGAAYWYASRGLGDKAVELAETAVKREPRYVWSHIALARGLMAQGKPVAAEQVLVRARAYGNFPTLEYEIASSRAAAGFFREAAEDLAKHFSLSGGGVKTNLGGRVAREEKSLFDLVAYERKASIFTPLAADTLDRSETLRSLLEFDQKLQAQAPNEVEIAAAADSFTAGSDKMKLHRQIYAASELLLKRVALGKILEITKAATGTTDAGLEVPAPGAAVMASELYESRAAAFRKNDFLLVPEVPKQTLSAILRGRIEEISGWALYNQGNFPDAVIRLRRAISVMPDKSAWWRSSTWRLGAALAADGKDAEALNYYIESYKTDKPDFTKYAVVESLYRKVNGTTDGLEAKIGSERVAIIQSMPELKPSPAPSETPATGTGTDTIQPATNDNPVAQPADTAKPAGNAGGNGQERPPSVENPAVVTEKPADLKKEPTVENPPEAQTITTVDPKPETKTESPPAEKKIETKTETTPADTQVEKSGAARPAASPLAANPSDNSQKFGTAKPLFEPIVITVPSRRPAKPATETTTTTTSSTEQKETSASDGTPAERDKEPVASTGASRPRVIDGRAVKPDVPPPCAIDFSQDNVSLINNGGKVGILVSMKDPGDIKTLSALSSSPADVEVTLEPEIGGLPDRRFYVIKSLSAKLGSYQVTFASPCAQKDLLVNVR